MTNQILVKSVVDTLREQGKKIATAESCTGGMLAQLITSIPGASEVFDYGIVSYANSIKQDMLNVDEEILNTYGAVSEQVATAMATGVMKACNADIGVGITGIAGPDGGTIEKPIGTVYVCIATPDSQNCCRLDLGECCKNNRSKIRDKAIYVVLDLVLKSLFNV
ncbi:MAG: CinA family protein, partial [Oscillospiraceae bacterium]